MILTPFAGAMLISTCQLFGVILMVIWYVVNIIGARISMVNLQSYLEEMKSTDYEVIEQWN